MLGEYRVDHPKVLACNTDRETRHAFARVEPKFFDGFRCADHQVAVLLQEIAKPGHHYTIGLGISLVLRGFVQPALNLGCSDAECRDTARLVHDSPRGGVLRSGGHGHMVRVPSDGRQAVTVEALMTTTTTGARQAEDPVTAGVAQAAARFERHGLEVDDHDLDLARELATSFRESRLEAAPSRAVELLAEQIAIAVLIRRQYDEPSITVDDIERYFESGRRFLNSFWHDDL